MKRMSYPKAQDGVKTAINLQKEKRDALYAKERARRAKNEESNKKARMTPSKRAEMEKSERNKPENAIGVGVGSIGKYMKSDPLKLAEKSKVATKSTPTKRKPTVKRVAAESVTAPKKDAPSTDLKKVTPTKGVDATSRNRVFTDKEKKIMAVMAKGKKKNGTMKTSAQRKIQRIRKSK